MGNGIKNYKLAQGFFSIILQEGYLKHNYYAIYGQYEENGETSCLWICYNDESEVKNVELIGKHGKLFKIMSFSKEKILKKMESLGFKENFQEAITTKKKFMEDFENLIEYFSIE